MNVPTSPQITRLAPPTPAERARIIALETESFSNPWTPESFDAMVSSPVAQVWVAREEGRILGFCAIYLIADEVYVNTIAVDKTARRRGIGTALITTVLRETGARAATLEVRESNLAARAMYQRLGFVEKGIRPGYYHGPDEDGLILWLNP